MSLWKAVLRDCVVKLNVLTCSILLPVFHSNHRKYKNDEWIYILYILMDYSLSKSKI